MKRLNPIVLFILKWVQSWQTKPDFILNRKSLSTKQVSGKFSFLNAFISGTLGVKTLLSIVVGIAGITSIAVYDIAINPDSPLFAGSPDSSETEAVNNELLADLSYLLSLRPELVVESADTEIAVDPPPENNDVINVPVVETGGDALEASPETGDKNITALFFVLTVVSFIYAVIICRRVKHSKRIPFK